MVSTQEGGKVIVRADMRKQEKNLDYHRALTTVYRKGTPKGDQGLTDFLMKGG